MNNYYCQYVFHNQEIIQGYCLNPKCKNPPQYCQQCLPLNHKDHIQDCKDRNQILQLINSSIESHNRFQRDIKSKKQNLEQIIERKLKQSSDEVEKLKKMGYFLQQEQYNDLKQNINILKNYHQEKVEQKNNGILIQQGEFLNQIDSFLKTIQKFQKDITQQHILNKQTDANMFYMEGIKYKDQDYQKALKSFSQAIDLDPSKEEYYVAKSGVLLNLNDFINAIQCCNDAIKLNSQSCSAYCNKGYALIRINSPYDARQCCEKAIQINPICVQAFITMGEILIHTNYYKDAISFCDKAIKINSNAFLALNYKAYALIMQGEYEKAQENCVKSLQINNKTNLEAYVLITYALNILKKFQDSLKYCDEAISNQIRSDDIYNNKGFALLNLKDYKNAKICFNEAIKINSYSHDAFGSRGDSLKGQQMFQGAINDYETAFQISNDNKYLVKRLTLELLLQKNGIKIISIN